MLKLIESDSPENLEYEVNGWIESQESDKRNIHVINIIPTMINKMEPNNIKGLNGPKVKTVWQAWIIYKKVYSPFN